VSSLKLTIRAATRRRYRHRSRRALPSYPPHLSPRAERRSHGSRTLRRRVVGRAGRVRGLTGVVAAGKATARLPVDRQQPRSARGAALVPQFVVDRQRALGPRAGAGDPRDRSRDDEPLRVAPARQHRPRSRHRRRSYRRRSGRTTGTLDDDETALVEYAVAVVRGEVNAVVHDEVAARYDDETIVGSPRPRAGTRPSAGSSTRSTSNWSRGPSSTGGTRDRSTATLPNPSNPADRSGPYRPTAASPTDRFDRGQIVSCA